MSIYQLTGDTSVFDADWDKAMHRIVRDLQD